MDLKKENTKAPPITNKVHVTGFPSYTQAQDLTRVFSEYGKVTLERLTKKFATLSFMKHDDAKAAVRASTKVNMYGEFLVVKHHQPQLEAPNTPKKYYPLTQKRGEIVSPFRIELTGEFLQQVDNLMAAVRLTQEEVNRLGRLYSDLEKVLQVLWPGCKAIPFGSIKTGLGIKSSDADCFISIPRERRHANENHVCRAKNVLQAHPEIFAEIIPIPRANTPIIKFFHLPSETNCDVTFKTPLGTQNSTLIAFLLQADPRFIPMAVIIKYWAKVHGLSGTRKLTNYALVMMIIFYLQQYPISILPSIRWLQQSPVDEYIIDFWNAGFMRYHERLPHSSNTSSMLELLGGFFQFYANFDFKDNVVCPYLGRPVNKEIFANTATLPAEFDRYKFNVERKYSLPIKFTTSMCVQDPIEQSHNVASAVSNKLASDIQEYFKYAAQAYEQDKHIGCKNFLRIILLQKPKIIRLKPTSEYKIHLTMRDVTNIADHDWKTVIKEIVDVVFEDMLKITLYKMEEKLTETQKEKVKFVGTVTRAVWKRKQFTRLYDTMPLSFAEKQSRITAEVMKVDKTMFELKFQMVATFYDEPKVGLALKYICGDMNLFREFGKFFNGILPSWLRTMMRPHLKPVTAGEPLDVAETIRSIDSNLDSSSDSEDDSSAGTPK